MKKMLLGSLMFVSGFIGIIALMCISIFKPWDYNGIQGFRGFLLGTDTEWFFTLYCILSALGLVLCIIEAYRKSNINDKIISSKVDKDD